MTSPKITIVTCTYNSASHLSETLESVKNQTYRNFEHIFIDGDSKDNTIDIINKYHQSPNISVGKDKSAYDAFNKGLQKASGDVIGFLHSDDTFFDNDALKRIAEAFENEDIDYYCSRMVIYDKNLDQNFAILGQKPQKQTLKSQLYSSNYFAHPTYYCKKEIIDKVGPFSLDYKIAGDIDWLYRLEKNTDKYFFDARPLVKFRGEGGLSAKNYFTGLKEEYIIRRKNEKLSLSLLFVYFYHFTRRFIRYSLEKFGLSKIITYSRKIIIKLAK